MRIELTGTVRSVCPDEGSANSVITVLGFQGPHPRNVRIVLTLDDEQARAFAAQYRRDKVVRITIEVDDLPDRKAGA